MSWRFRAGKMAPLLAPRTASTDSGPKRLNSSRPTFNVLTYGETARAQPAAVSRSRAARAPAIGARGLVLLVTAPAPRRACRRRRDRDLPAAPVRAADARARRCHARV